MRFYQRLWLGIRYKRVDKKLVPWLLGKIYIYWYFLSFKNDLIGKTDWSIKNDLEELHSWLEKKMDSSDYENIKRRMQQKNLIKINEFVLESSELSLPSDTKDEEKAEPDENASNLDLE